MGGKITMSLPAIAMVLFLLLQHIFCDSPPCTLTEGDQNYDLRPLTLSQSPGQGPGIYKVNPESVKAAEHLSETSQSIGYWLNVCGKITGMQGLLEESAVFRNTTDSNDKISLGKSSPTLSRVGEFLSLTYSFGDKCKDDLKTVERSSLILFECDKSAQTSLPSLVSIYKTCFYTFHWKTAAACPKASLSNDNDSTKSGFSFFKVIFSLLMVYLILGIAYNRFIKNERGWGQIPNQTIWVALIVGAVTAFHSLLDKCRGNRSQSLSFNGDRYRTLPRDVEEAGVFMPDGEGSDFEEQ